jgi:catechol 2,3-dioxygenase-like lactoylglutathione lyase family enzyme
MFKGTTAYSGFATDDLDKAREFYGGTLGLNFEVPDAEAAVDELTCP